MMGNRLGAPAGSHTTAVAGLCQRRGAREAGDGDEDGPKAAYETGFEKVEGTIIKSRMGHYKK